jgi:uncharacterized membrane protein SpoIIM required for sporulation
MAEALAPFVRRRKADWDALEHLLSRHARRELELSDLSELDRLYRHATSDLAFVRASHAGSDVDRFLNQLVSSAYRAIYRPEPARWASLVRFYRDELPRVFRAERAAVGLSAVLFVAGIVVGAAIVLWVPTGAEQLVPEHLRRYIDDRRIWTDEILSVSPPNAVASSIATNNLSVTFAAFAGGIAAGLGTVYILVLNGVMIGSLAAYCVQEDMGAKLFDFVAAHGPVELSIIVLSGGAGLILARALVAPGELPRSQRLQAQGKEAVKLVVGLAPFLALIGIVEGFISPGAMFSTGVKAAVGFSLGALLWGYLFSVGRSGSTSHGVTAGGSSSSSRL